MVFRLFIVALAISIGSVARADVREFVVFDMKHNLPLKRTQRVHKDFYVSMGLVDGVKKGDVLAVFRKIPIVDVYREKSMGDMSVEIGTLKVIHVEERLAVARLQKIGFGVDAPVLDYEQIMLGDRVRLFEMESEKPKLVKAVRKVAAVRTRRISKNDITGSQAEDSSEQNAVAAPVGPVPETKYPGATPH